MDHDDWGRPEDMTKARPAFAITTTKPGSELAGETAAALAAASMLFKTSNSAYSSTLLSHARQLFTFADQYKGNYHQSIPKAAAFYPYVYVIHLFLQKAASKFYFLKNSYFCSLWSRKSAMKL